MIMMQCCVLVFPSRPFLDFLMWLSVLFGWRNFCCDLRQRELSSKALANSEKGVADAIEAMAENRGFTRMAMQTLRWKFVLTSTAMSLSCCRK